jgi:hypothetical protein
VIECRRRKSPRSGVTRRRGRKIFTGSVHQSERLVPSSGTSCAPPGPTLVRSRAAKVAGGRSATGDARRVMWRWMRARSPRRRGVARRAARAPATSWRARPPRQRKARRMPQPAFRSRSDVQRDLYRSVPDGAARSSQRG